MTGLQVEFASDKSKPWTKFYPDDFSVEDLKSDRYIRKKPTLIDY